MSVSYIKITPDEDGLRLDRWFKNHYPSLPPSLLHKLLRTGQIRVDGGRVKNNSRIAAGQKVRIPPFENNPKMPMQMDEELARKRIKRFMDMVIYEDKDIFILNKPNGISVQGGSGQKTNDHIDAMLQAFEAIGQTRGRLVHRLDKDTSGLLVIARSRPIASQLAQLFATRSVRKIYWAGVYGVPSPRQGTIEASLIKSEASPNHKVELDIGGRLEGSKKAKTFYNIVMSCKPSFSWVSLKPVTGRQHQLRAHMASIGHPILGDSKYAFKFAPIPHMQNKLYLHARRLSFPHPNGSKIDITAPLPTHFITTWQKSGLDPYKYDEK